MSSVAGWAEYRTGTWHAHAPPAWKGDGHRSLCGHSIRARPEQLRDEPRGRRCRSCMARLRRMDRDRNDRTPSGLSLRKVRAQEWAEALSAMVAKVACRCAREWPGAHELTTEAEARVCALLLAWECSGDRTTSREAKAAARAYVGAWQEAVRQYDLLDGSHPYREAAR